MELRENCEIILEAQSLTGKTLVSKELDTFLRICTVFWSWGCAGSFDRHLPRKLFCLQ